MHSEYTDYTPSCSKERQALQEISAHGLLAVLENIGYLWSVVNTIKYSTTLKESGRVPLI